MLIACPLCRRLNRPDDRQSRPSKCSRCGGLLPEPEPLDVAPPAVPETSCRPARSSVGMQVVAFAASLLLLQLLFTICGKRTTDYSYPDPNYANGIQPSRFRHQPARGHVRRSRPTLTARACGDR